MRWEVRGAGLERRGWKEAGWGVGEGPVQVRKDSHAPGDPGCSDPMPSGGAPPSEEGSRSGELSLQVSENGCGNGHPWQGLSPLSAASRNSRETFSAIAGLGELHLGSPYPPAPSSVEGAPSPHPTLPHVASFPSDTWQANGLQY